MIWRVVVLALDLRSFGLGLAALAAGCLSQKTYPAQMDADTSTSKMDAMIVQLDATVDAAASKCGSMVCKAPALICDTAGATPRCIDCMGDGDCMDPAKPVCNTVNKACVGCTSSAQCAGRFVGKQICDLTSGRCGACTRATQQADCLGNACDPETVTCTGSALGSLQQCDACTADDECAVGLKCVGTTFQEYRLGMASLKPAVNAGRFCLTRIPAGAAANFCSTMTLPVMVGLSLLNSTSVQGATADYCAPVSVTTCRALRDYIAAKACGTDSAVCGVSNLADGFCFNSKCSVACSNGIMDVFACGGTQPPYCQYTDVAGGTTYICR